MWYLIGGLLTLELYEDDVGFWKGLMILVFWPTYLGAWIKRNFEK